MYSVVRKYPIGKGDGSNKHMILKGNTMVYQIRITRWSNEDRNYLINNNLGWVSDCEKYWCFSDEESMKQFARYQGICEQYGW